MILRQPKYLGCGATSNCYFMKLFFRPLWWTDILGSGESLVLPVARTSKPRLHTSCRPSPKCLTWGRDLVEDFSELMTCPKFTENHIRWTSMHYVIFDGTKLIITYITLSMAGYNTLPLKNRKMCVSGKIFLIRLISFASHRALKDCSLPPGQGNRLRQTDDGGGRRGCAWD